MTQGGLLKRKGSGGHSTVSAAAAILLATGLFSRAVLQNGLLSLNTRNAEELFMLFEESRGAMQIAAVSLLGQAVGLCCVPLYAFLLWERVKKEKSLKGVAFKLFFLALCAEIPYEIAIRGRFFSRESTNPLFAAAVALIFLYLIRENRVEGLKGVFFKGVIFLAAVSWVLILKTDEGVPFVIISASFGAFQKGKGASLAPVVACAVCTALSTFYILTPLSLIILHFFGRKEETE